MSDELTRLGAELLPAARETLLLRACTASPEVARASWDEWCARVGDPAVALPKAGAQGRALGPLLDLRLREAGADVPDELRAALRAAATRERERTATMRAGVAEALGVLDAAGVDPTLTGGFAVAETAYPEPGLRHCHDVDVLIAGGERERATRALAGRGGGAESPQHRGRLVVGHPLGAPVALHDRLFTLPGPRPEIASMLGRRREVRVDGAQARALAADDLLLQVVGRGVCDVPAGYLRWAVDAAEIARGAVDWERFAATASRSRLTGILAIGLGYLRRRARRPGACGGPSRFVARRRRPRPRRGAAPPPLERCVDA